MKTASRHPGFVDTIPHGIRILLFSHSLFWLATNLLSPFLSIFYISELVGVTLAEIGIASLIFFLSFGVVEPVVGIISDKIKGLQDEIFFVIMAYFARGFMFILLAFATNVWHLYMFQFAMGIFRALAGPGDKLIYAKLMGKKQKAIYWGLDESIINLSAALGAGVGGYLAYILGIRVLLFVAGYITIAAGFINMFVIRDVTTKGKK